jgi:uncharacterized protein YjbI with pentapeptide repeats
MLRLAFETVSSWITGIKAVGLGILATGIFLAAWWLWWRLPKRQVDRLRLTIRDPMARAGLEDNFRKTIGQLLGGGAVLIGVALAYLQFSQQQQTSQNQFLQQQQALRDLLISNQVSKGFEQLGSDKMVVRLGGIYALEGLMNTSEQYHQSVLEALCGFVRDGTRKETDDRPPTTDIQTALTAIGRRKPIATEKRLDLANAHIPQANLRVAFLNGADLSDAFLRDAHLDGAHLIGADLREAFLNGADLSDAFLNGAHLNDAFLRDAHLDSTHLHGADLREADLSGADLRAADLNGANLSGAHLNSANLRSAELSGANLSGTNLSNADLHDADLNGAKLTVANLTGALVFREQLDKACGAEAKLDPGLILKPCQ